MPAQTALTETRSWSVRCRVRLVVECEGSRTVTTDDLDGHASTRAAEAAVRDHGWTIHTDGTATCPTCTDVAAGRLRLEYRGAIGIADYPDEDELADLVGIDRTDPDWPHAVAATLHTGITLEESTDANL